MCGSCTPALPTGDVTSDAPGEADRARGSGIGRRGLLYGGLGASAALTAALASAGPAAATTSGPVRRSDAPMRAVLVGTAGGPIWPMASGRRGICTVVEVDGARYLIDAGHGSAAGMVDAGVIGPADGKNDLTAFRAGFITHLHSDHVTDLSTFLVQGFIAGGLGSVESPFHLYGPGDRGALPAVFPPGRPTPTAFNPTEPTPGTASMVRQLLAAFATDVNDRIFDAGSPPVDRVVQAHDIELPAGVAVPVAGPPARMSPFTVHEDDRVRVSATLVEHGQMAPSYAYRFDSDHGSIVISGDTTLTPNLLEMADGCDVLLHEVVDQATIEASISALPVPEEIKEAFRNHMFGAHTTEAQLKELLRDVEIGQLVLHHVVPGELPRGGWQRVAQRLGRGTRTGVVAGRDGDVIGTR
ncbi:MBL fold metallo-hydrolase [Janibacter anophelis]|uniref:MBL fold metallo-hydrolase n=1 Tax=Janibacter anophelis TaxID=319054 RepID=UPI003F7D5C42